MIDEMDIRSSILFVTSCIVTIVIVAIVMKCFA